jgi:XRE family transcriptional regulator, regulator of sulfur utilization
MSTTSSATVRATVGGNVKRLRLQRGLSAGELARRAGIGKATLSEIEAGKRNATLDTVHALTLALGVPLGAPLADVSDPGFAGQSVRADLATRLEGPDGITELYRVQLRRRADPHQATHSRGLIKTAIVFRGTLLVSSRSAQRQISLGRSAQWTAEEPETYAAVDDQDVEAALLLRYPGSAVH